MRPTIRSKLVVCLNFLTNLQTTLECRSCLPDCWPLPEGSMILPTVTPNRPRCLANSEKMPHTHFLFWYVRSSRRSPFEWGLSYCLGTATIAYQMNSFGMRRCEIGPSTVGIHTARRNLYFIMPMLLCFVIF